MRNGISDFSLSNSLYRGATVTFYTVSSGVKTTTKAAVYAGITGSATLANPQTLDNNGRLFQPAYVDAPVIAVVSGLTIPEHETGVINAVLSADSIADVLTSFALSTGSALIGFIQAGVSAVLRTVQSKLRENFSVEDFGAVGGGATDDRAAIQAAIDAKFVAGGGEVLFGAKTYAVGDALVLKTGVILLGQGSSATRIYLLDGANSNILETVDFATLTGSNLWHVADGVPYGFGVDKMTLDGNSAGQTVAGGVAFYGKGYSVGDDLKIVDTFGVGFYSECAFVGGQESEFDMPEGRIGKLSVYKAGQEGVIYRGPHDQPIGDIFVSQAGQQSPCDGVIFDAKSGAYQGATDVSGVVHSYANTARGITIRCQLKGGHIIGESNVKEGVYFEGQHPTGEWVGSWYSEIAMLEAYNNGQGNPGDVYEVRSEAVRTTIGDLLIACREAGESIGGLYNTGPGNRFEGGTITDAGLTVANRTGFKSSGNHVYANLSILDFDVTGGVSFESGTGANCNYSIIAHEFDTAWLNSGLSALSSFKIYANSNSGTPVTDTGSLLQTNSYDVTLSAGATVRLSWYKGPTSSIVFGSTSTTISHLAFKTPRPEEIIIAKTNDWATNRQWIDNITATTFDVVTDTAAPAGGLLFSWRLDI
jgi:hypothetical protein